MAEDHRMILAGGIGGTKTNLAYFDIKNERPIPVMEETISSRDFATLDDLLLTFISSVGGEIVCVLL